MKKLIFLFIIVLWCTSCDPVSDLEANIENKTSQELLIEFIAFDKSFDKTLKIPINEIRVFQEGFEIGSAYLEPSLSEFDSIVVKNTFNQILKVYKPNDTGRNIYDIPNWLASEPSKRYFKYEFEITDQDIE